MSSAEPSHPATGDEGTAVTAYLLAGPLTFGGLGWGADSLVGTSPVFVLLGVLSGTALALYVIWLRYGGAQRSAAPMMAAAGTSPARGEDARRNGPADGTTKEETT